MPAMWYGTQSSQMNYFPVSEIKLKTRGGTSSGKSYDLISLVFKK